MPRLPFSTADVAAACNKDHFFRQADVRESADSISSLVSGRMLWAALGNINDPSMDIIVHTVFAIRYSAMTSQERQRIVPKEQQPT